MSDSADQDPSVGDSVFGSVDTSKGFDSKILHSKCRNGRDFLSASIDESPQSATRLSPKEMNELRKRLLNPTDSYSDPQFDFEASDFFDNRPFSGRLSNERKTPQNQVGPSVPDWMHKRPHLSLDFLQSEQHQEVGPLGDVAVNSQEHQLLEDLLSLLMGIEGIYITLRNDNGVRSFVVDQSVEQSVSALVHKILPVCLQYAQLVKFIEVNSVHQRGLINHALSAALTTLIKDYLLLVVQLESQHRTGTLTLYKLWFYIEKIAPVMDMLASITSELSKSSARGGEVLSIMHSRVQSLTGCGKLQEMAVYLTTCAAQPFMTCLQCWLTQGIITDPYSEFMVQDVKAKSNNDESMQSSQIFTSNDATHDDSYWQLKYRVSSNNIPIFLAHHVDLILRTGKYLNVIRESAQGRNGVAPLASNASLAGEPPLSYSTNEQQQTNFIESAYNFASKTLLNHLITDMNLMKRIKCLKQYFLLSQGDFISHLLNLCENELAKPIDDVLPHRLEYLLELALRTSDSSDYQDTIHTVLLPYTLIEQMMRILSIERVEEQEHKDALSRLDLTGVEGFSLSCSVPWPASLVLDNRALFCYQMLFRQLFYCKHVERQLCKVWLSTKCGKRMPMSLRRGYAASYLLRQKMLAFVQNIQYYMTFEVIEKHWQQFIDNMAKVESIDEVLQHQSHFLDKCLKDCLLTCPELLRTLTKIINICGSFANFILKTNKQRDRAECFSMSYDSSSREKEHSVDKYSDSESFSQTVARYDIQFNGMLVTLMDKVADRGGQDYTDAVVNILYRLDFNKYYTEHSDGLSKIGENLNAAADEAVTG